MKNSVILKNGKERSVLKGHPWLFSGALSKTPETAGLYPVLSDKGEFLAWGSFDPLSHIPVHLVSFREDFDPSSEWWTDLVRRAVLRRKDFFSLGETDSFRLIHGEADFLAGLTADVFKKIIRLTVSSRLAYSHLDETVAVLEDMLGPDMVIADTDSAFTASEHLPREVRYYKEGVRFQPKEKLSPITIKEDGLLYSFIPGTGQKSGFFCDQRENRKAAEKYFKDAVVLDACCYTGGFTLHALRGGALSVDALDASSDALFSLVHNVDINAAAKTIPSDSRSRITTQKCDVFSGIRTIEDDKYSVIVLDPPKLASTKSALDNALRGYKDLNRIAMAKIKDGGILITCSCSGAVSPEDFSTMLGWAAKDAGVQIQILETLGQPADHPVRLSMPESRYLKVMILRVVKG